VEIEKEFEEFLRVQFIEAIGMKEQGMRKEAEKVLPALFFFLFCNF